jgi:hypothetical protein
MSAGFGQTQSERVGDPHKAELPDHGQVRINLPGIAQVEVMKNNGVRQSEGV